MSQTSRSGDQPALSREGFKDSSGDIEYWGSKTPEERLEYMQQLREHYFGDMVNGPMQRVLEIVNLNDYTSQDRRS